MRIEYSGGMKARRDEAEESRTTGLCATCAHGRRIESPRGSKFWLCELSKTDSRFPKYPRLPVLACAGYVRRKEPASGG